MKSYFSNEEYWDVIRPKAERLKDFPDDPLFENPKFWGPAKDSKGEVKNLFKMKWHNLGSGKVQLRQVVAILEDKAYLLKAYVKNNEKYDMRQIAISKIHLDLIKQGRVKILGEL